MVKTPTYDRSSMRRGHWNEDEDMGRIRNLNITPNKAGLKRCAKSCRPRHTNNHKDDNRNESFTAEDEELIIKLHQAIGSRWAIIAQQLPGRAENEVKNYWNTKLKKKLTEMGIDPVTHRPFSQLLADYGNMSGLPRHRSIDSKNAFVFKTNQGLIIPQDSVDSSSNNLLAQLQSIKLVTEASKNSKNEVNIMQSDNSSSSFSWRDLLVEDLFLPCKEGENEVFSEIDLKLKDKAIFEPFEEKGFEASSSFVEAIVERQNEMLLDFPELLEDSFSY